MRTSSARQQGFENKPRLGFKLLPGHGNPHFRSLGVIFLLWRQDNAQFVALRVTQTTPNTVCFNPKALQVVPILGHRARFGGGSAPGGANSGTPGEVRRGKRDRWCGFWDTGRDAGEVRARCGCGADLNGQEALSVLHGPGFCLGLSRSLGRRHHWRDKLTTRTQLFLTILPFPHVVLVTRNIMFIQVLALADLVFRTVCIHLQDLFSRKHRNNYLQK